jgi:hypothetical protein
MQVARRFLAAVKECSGPELNMALFISCDAADVMRQAEDSTRRYQQGTNPSTNQGFKFSFRQFLDRSPAKLELKKGNPAFISHS